MYRFHYDYRFFVYKVETKDFYEDMKSDGDKYDMSNFDCDLTKKYKDNTNKKVVGACKDEADGQIWSEFVGLRPKMYSASMHNGKEKKTGKGIKRDYLKKILHMLIMRNVYNLR
jgi:hypothetical protein